MIQILSYFPGQTATIFLEVTDGYFNVRQDSLTTPIVNRIFKPDFSLLDGYSQQMTRLDTGLYYFQFVLPSGGSAVGSYLVDVSYNEQSGFNGMATYQIIVNAPYGNYSATIG